MIITDEAILSEWYINGATGVVPDDYQPPVPADHPLHLLTICVLVLRNGFVVTGEAFAGDEGFDVSAMKMVARRSAASKILTHDMPGN